MVEEGDEPADARVKSGSDASVGGGRAPEYPPLGLWQSSERVSSWARGEGIAHKHTHFQDRGPCTIDFDSVEHMQELKMLASFFARVPWAEISARKRGEVIEYFRNAKALGYCERHSGCIVIPAETAHFGVGVDH